jgi:hypothetical protein
MLIFMMPLLIIGVILLILVFTAYKAFNCSNKSETLACNLWRLAHVLTAVIGIWQVYIKYQKVKAEAEKVKAAAKKAFSSPAPPERKTPAAPMLAPPPAL